MYDKKKAMTSLERDGFEIEIYVETFISPKQQALIQRHLKQSKSFFKDVKVLFQRRANV